MHRKIEGLKQDSKGKLDEASLLSKITEEDSFVYEKVFVTGRLGLSLLN
jgi:hypothetical protein